jgi:hypothetical protein
MHPSVVPANVANTNDLHAIVLHTNVGLPTLPTHKIFMIGVSNIFFDYAL